MKSSWQKYLKHQIHHWGFSLVVGWGVGGLNRVHPNNLIKIVMPITHILHEFKRTAWQTARNYCLNDHYCIKQFKLIKSPLIHGTCLNFLTKNYTVFDYTYNSFYRLGQWGIGIGNGFILPLFLNVYFLHACGSPRENGHIILKLKWFKQKTCQSTLLLLITY